MAKFRKVQTAFWDDGFIENLSPEDKFFYLFLMTNPMSTECGIYVITKKKMSYYTGYTQESVDNILRRMIGYGRVKYNESTSEVFLVNRAKYFPEKSSKPIIDCLRSELSNIRNTSFIKDSLQNIENKDIKELFASFIPIGGNEPSTERGEDEDEDENKDEVLNTPPLSPAGGEQFEETTDSSKEKKPNTIPLPGPGPGEAQLDLMARQATFKEEVYQVGGLTYTSEMLNRFIQTYSQPNDAKKPKMRWEVEKKKKGWDTKDRLALWAKRNLDGIQCFLTVDDQKTIKDKRAEFAKSIEAFKDRYTRDMLLEFYRYWSLPEQCHNPKRLRWELQGFWDLGTKLAEWESRDSKRTKQFSHQQR